MDTHPHPTGAGAIIRTEYEHVDLGTHGHRALRARVRRRSLRIGLGRRRGFGVTLGQLRPVAIEVTEGDARYDVPVKLPADPWLRFAWRVALLCFASLALTRIVGARRRPERTAAPA